MQLAWLTDIHLNTLNQQQKLAFLNQVKHSESDALLISGDISKPQWINQHLSEMANHYQRPIYFVLGNHDYDQAHLETVREQIQHTCQTNRWLHWLPDSIQALNTSTYIAGCDGWSDGRNGNFNHAHLHHKEHCMALNFKHHKLSGKHSLQVKMQQVADQEAALLHQHLSLAKNSGATQVVVGTHFPPFKESCYHRNRPSNSRELPFFSSKASGDALTLFAKQNPAIQLRVYCGHTHSQATHQAEDNLIVYTGSATYGEPTIQQIINL